jgi:hypothetical protein
LYLIFGHGLWRLSRGCGLRKLSGWRVGQGRDLFSDGIEANGLMRMVIVGVLVGHGEADVSEGYAAK